MAVGDVQLTGDGGRTYTLNFGVNGMCRLEANDPQQRSHHVIVNEVHRSQSMLAIRRFMAAALVDPEGQTLDQVGDILEDIGGAAVLMDAFAASHSAIAYPVPELTRG